MAWKGCDKIEQVILAQRFHEVGIRTQRVSAFDHLQLSQLTQDDSEHPRVLRMSLNGLENFITAHSGESQVEQKHSGKRRSDCGELLGLAQITHGFRAIAKVADRICYAMAFEGAQDQVCVGLRVFN